MQAQVAVERCRRVLLTGASGFVGTAIMERLLECGCEVQVLALPETVEQLKHKDRIRVFQGTLTDAGLLKHATKGVNVVYHFGAALPSPRADEIKEVNIHGTEKLLWACVKNRVERIVFASSMAVYQPVFMRSRWPMTEESPLLSPDSGARSEYPRSKIAGEELVRQFHQEYGLEYSILRFPIVYGVGAPLVENLIQEIMGRAMLVSSRASTVPGMQGVHVQDLARAAEMAGTRPEAANQTFNIASDQIFSIRDMLTEVTAYAGIEYPEPKSIHPTIQAVASQMFDRTKLKYDVGKARLVMGFEPEIRIADCFRQIAADMDKRGLLPRRLPERPPLPNIQVIVAAVVGLLTMQKRQRG
ncbi:MAG TPA: NAD(P)-dependent oxidoreductase [Gemmatimonadales bacterium]|nr:NAD(P)-dependent oxidoreductase [Gemmatimonadales bacterium]